MKNFVPLFFLSSLSFAYDLNCQFDTRSSQNDWSASLSAANGFQHKNLIQGFRISSKIEMGGAALPNLFRIDLQEGNKPSVQLMTYLLDNRHALIVFKNEDRYTLECRVSPY